MFSFANLDLLFQNQNMVVELSVFIGILFIFQVLFLKSKLDFLLSVAALFWLEYYSCQTWHCKPVFNEETSYYIHTPFFWVGIFLVLFSFTTTLYVNQTYQPKIRLFSTFTITFFAFILLAGADIHSVIPVVGAWGASVFRSTLEHRFNEGEDLIQLYPSEWGEDKDTWWSSWRIHHSWFEKE